MKALFTQFFIAVLLMGIFAGGVQAQTGVLNPNDPVVTYNAASPPASPPYTSLAKWVRTKRVSYATDDFKCYIYNGIQFRLKWPKTWTSAADGKMYPLYLFFHGVGERGSVYDNEFQLSHGGDVHQAAVNSGKFDGFLLYPQSQSASGGWSQAQIDLLVNLINNYLIPEMKVDPSRINVNGLSGGGSATWEFAESHANIVSAVLPISAATISDMNYVNLLKFTPIWLFQGGLDKAPDPSTTIQLVNAYNNAGGNLKYTVYPTLGHNSWDQAWKEPDYFPFMMRSHQANPWVLTGKNQFCPGESINATLGVVGGLAGYQWRKDGVVIGGATSNTLQVTATGTYDCSVLHGSSWSVFSPTPMVIGIKAPTVSPNIQVSGLASNVLPAPDGSNSVSLMVPANYTSYIWQRVDSPAGNPATLSSTTNVLTGATPGQYAVKVTEQFGCSSTFSNPFTVISAAGPNAPSAPLNLAATTVSKTSIKVKWSEAVSQPNPETQFEVYQGTSTNGPFKLVGFTAANVDSFVVTGLTPKTTYSYLVRAINNTAASASAGPSSAQTQSDVTAPTTPGNLRVSSASQTAVTLLWDASTDDVAVTGYDIYVNGNLTATVGNVNTFAVYNLVNAQTYTFTVKAKDFAGNASPFSNQLVAVPSLTGVNYTYYTGTWTTLPDFNALSPVSTGTLTNISLSPATSTKSFGFVYTGYINFPVAGSYTFQTTSVDGSELYIDVPYTASATPTVSNDGVHTSQTVTGSAKTYTAGVHTFTLIYFKGTSSTAASLAIKWKTPQSSNQFVAIPNASFVQNATVTGTVPTAPSVVTAAAASAKKINLAWHDNSSNEAGFQIFRSTSSGGTYLTVATVKPGRTTYGDSSLNPGTTYYYKLQAINQSGSSAFSAVANAKTNALPALPAAPTALSGISEGPTHALLSWTNAAGAAATGFEVWRSPESNTNYVLAATLPVATSYTDSGLVNNTQYYYKLRTINEAGTSAYGNEISLVTSSAAVTTVTLTAIVNQNLTNDTTVILGINASSSSAGAAITYTTSGMPAFATLADNHNGTASLTLKPNSTHLGIYNGIVVTATDVFGGSSSDTFNIAVNGKNGTIVQVSFNTSNYPVTTTGWNGMNVAGAVAGVSVGNFKDVNGNTTTTGISLQSSWDGAYATGMNTGTDGGIYPDNVLKNFYFGSTFNPYVFKVTGLSSSKKYALVFFAGYPWSPSDVATYGNMITNYTVGSQTVTLNVANNISNTVQLSGLSPDASGAITVTITKPLGTAYCLISDLQIMSYDAAAGTTALLPPTNLTASGLTNNSVKLNWTGSPDTRTGFEIWSSNKPTGTFSLRATVDGNTTTYTDAGLPSNSTYFYKVREVVAGNQYSDYSNIAGGSTVQYTVNISMNSQTAGSQPAPWNDLNSLIADGFSLTNLMDMKGQKTGLNFNVVTNFTSFNDQLGLTTGNNSGVVPDAVMQTFYYNSQGDTARVSISGLSKTGVYNFGFYGGTNFSNAPTIGYYQIGNQVVSLNAYNNTTNMVFISGVKPDSTGTVLITFYTDDFTPYAMWNSLTIQGMPSPDVIAADSAGTAGVIATRLSNPNGVVGTGARLNDATSSLSVDSANSLNLSSGLEAYPNPFVDNVTVKFDIQQNVAKFTLVIVDVAGRIVQKQEYSDTPAGTWQKVLNLSALNKGIYFIQVYGLPDNKVKSFRLVKVK